MSQPPASGDSRRPHAANEHVDRDASTDSEEDDWAWRRRIRATPATAKAYRVAVFIVGLVIVVVGLLLIPFPGPGWLIVIAGLAIWATEFEKAQRVLEFVKSKLRVWEEWVKRQNLFVKGLVGIVGIAFIATILWLTFHFSGIPGFFPDALANWMRTTARI